MWVPGSPALGIKWLGSEADHSPPSSTAVKNACSYTSTPPYIFTAWCLVRQRENFILPLPKRVSTAYTWIYCNKFQIPSYA